VTPDDYIWWPKDGVLLCRPQLYDTYGLPIGGYRAKDIRQQNVMRDATLAVTSDCGFTSEDAFWRGPWPRRLYFLKINISRLRGTMVDVDKVGFRLLMIN
jgi:hypothetical protein